MNSIIIIAKNIKLDKNYTNVVDYTEQQMLNLVESNKVAKANDYSFIRQNRNTISVNFDYVDCLKCNYMAFQNKDYSNKWFFAWIDDVIYKGNNCTEILYTIDSWSTFFNDCNINDCLVVREHTNDDTIGNNTESEPVNLNNYIVENFDKFDMTNNEEYEALSLIVSSTKYLAGENVGDNATLLQKILGSYTPNAWYLLRDSGDMLQFFNEISKITSLKDIFREPTKGINNMFLIPKKLSNEIDTSDEQQVLSSNFFPIEFDFTIEKNNTFSDFEFKNNKLLTFPYNYLRLTNLQGQYVNLKYELFNNSIKFKIIATISDNGANILCIPYNYSNIELNYETSIPCGKFPNISWANDNYRQWLSNSAISTASSLLTSAVGIATNQPIIAAGGVANFVGNLTSSYLNTMNTPNNINGVNTSGDVLTAYNDNTFFFYRIRGKKEELQIIDNYFTKYGYATNRLKKPNIIGRKYFNYVMVGNNEIVCNGDVPTKYIDDINNAFKSGVTIWHNHNNIGDYSLNNEII